MPEGVLCALLQKIVCIVFLVSTLTVLYCTADISFCMKEIVQSWTNYYKFFISSQNFDYISLLRTKNIFQNKEMFKIM